jgi:hypothetical protein
MQRVNAPAGQMQLKGLIEAYVVSELSFIVEQLNVYLEVCVSNVLLILDVLKGKNGQRERCHNFEGMGGIFATLLATGTTQRRRLA